MYRNCTVRMVMLSFSVVDILSMLLLMSWCRPYIKMHIRLNWLANSLKVSTTNQVQDISYRIAWV